MSLVCPLAKTACPGRRSCRPSTTPTRLLYGQFDPSRLQYGTTPPVFHIVAAVDDHEPFELGVEYEIEIRRKRP